MFGLSQEGDEPVCPCWSLKPASSRTQWLLGSEAVPPLKVAPKWLEGTESWQTREEREDCAVADLHV